MQMKEMWTFRIVFKNLEMSSGCMHISPRRYSTILIFKSLQYVSLCWLEKPSCLLLCWQSPYRPIHRNNKNPDKFKRWKLKICSNFRNKFKKRNSICELKDSHSGKKQSNGEIAIQVHGLACNMLLPKRILVCFFVGFILVVLFLFDLLSSFK